MHDSRYTHMYMPQIISRHIHMSYVCMYIHICDMNVCVTTCVIHIEMLHELEHDRTIDQ